MFQNPVTSAPIDNFPDPTVIRGRDGFWYAYGTGGAWTQGGDYHRMQIARSDDLVSWEYVSDVFTAETEPRYDGKGDDAQRMYWAPAIEYVDGRYVLYYSYVVNDGDDRSWRAIGAATAPTPAGPWTDSGAAVVPPSTWSPRPGVELTSTTIDPELVTGPDGTRYLFYGGWDGGVRAVQLSTDGLRSVGETTQIALPVRYEAPYVVRHGEYYYLFLSALGGCCDGPVSAYPVHVARSKNVLGPYVARDGSSMLDQHGSGTLVQAPNGNQWVSTGHTAQATDAAGQDWLVSHAIDRGDPFRWGRASKRPMVINRLDWIDGWPTARAGRGLPDGVARAPEVDPWVADAFEAGDGIGRVWRPAPGWDVDHEAAGGYVRGERGADRDLQARRPVHGDLRVRGAVRLESDTPGSAGFTLGRRHHDHDHGRGGVRVTIDRSAGALVAEVDRAGRTSRTTTPLPASFSYRDWHELEIRIRGRTLRAEVSNVGQYGPVATVQTRLPRQRGAGLLGLTADDTDAGFDDITAASLATPVTTKAPDPEVGPPDASLAEEFDNTLGDEWNWVREPAADVESGQLAFGVQSGEIIDERPGPDNTASLLLRELPEGDWTAETRVRVPFGETLPHEWPQAGLVVYGGDDQHVSLTVTAKDGTRMNSFGKEIIDQQSPLYAFGQVGATADTMWLRLQHRVDDENAEHEFRAATSTDGKHWTWHGVRTLPTDADLRIGFGAFGGLTGENYLARFDYLRFFRPR